MTSVGTSDSSESYPMTPNNTVGALKDIVRQHREDSFELASSFLHNDSETVEAIKEWADSHYLSLFLDELVGKDELLIYETGDIHESSQNLTKTDRNQFREELRAKAKTLLSKEGL